jgi:hypothetical protein
VSPADGDGGTRRASRRGPVRSVAATLARRREARAPRVIVKSAGGQTRVLAPDEPSAQAALEAAETLISAAQRGLAD